MFYTYLLEKVIYKLNIHIPSILASKHKKISIDEGTADKTVLHLQQLRLIGTWADATSEHTYLNKDEKITQICMSLWIFKVKLPQFMLHEGKSQL